MRINWWRVGLMSSLLILLVLITFRYRYELVGSDVYRIDALTEHFCKYPCATFPPQDLATPGRSPTPFNVPDYISKQPVDEQLADAKVQRLKQLQSVASPLDMANFGQAWTADTFHLEAGTGIKQVFEASDGQLYAISSSGALIEGTEADHLALIEGGSWNEIWLPHRRGNWINMELLPSSAGDTAIIRAHDIVTGATREFAVSASQIARVPVTKVELPYVPPTHMLHSEEMCAVEQSRLSPTLVWAVNRKGRWRPLVSKSDFLQSANNVVTVSDVRDALCDHFYDIDMLVVGDSYHIPTTFVITPDRIRAAVPASPAFMTKNHMILGRPQYTDMNELIGWDYVNVRPKKPL